MNGFTGLYFSFITLSTVGYGDIIPVSEVARMLAIVEAMFGMFYMTLLIARLVSLYSSKSPFEITNREEILRQEKNRVRELTNNQQQLGRMRIGLAYHSRSAKCRCENGGSSQVADRLMPESDRARFVSYTLCLYYELL